MQLPDADLFVLMVLATRKSRDAERAFAELQWRQSRRPESDVDEPDRSKATCYDLLRKIEL